METIGIKRCIIFLIISVETSLALSGAADTEPEPVKDISSKEMEPLVLEMPTTAAPQPDADGSGIHTLQYVGIIFRHGDRFKDKHEVFENDPFALEDPFWMPVGFGQLRARGKFRMFYMGQMLRQRYNGFLKDEYYYQTVRFYSPDVDRCLMSAQLVALGLFPPLGINIWNDNVGKFYQPIPIKSFDFGQDNIFNDGKTCPPYEHELTKILNTKFKDINIRYKDIYEYLSYYTGKNISNLQDVNNVYQVLRLENENGRPMPDWVKAVFPSKLKALAGLYNQVVYYNDQMRTIRAGPILTQILKDLASKTTHLMDRKLKMKVWTGFDSTLLKVLHTLRFKEKYGISDIEAVMKENPDDFAPKPPPQDDVMETGYGAAVIIELHFINRKYYIKVLYQDGGYNRPPRVIHLNECNNETLIPYEKFAKTYGKFVISDEEWNQRCGVATC